jgi:hypothetical protein
MTGRRAAAAQLEFQAALAQFAAAEVQLEASENEDLVPAAIVKHQDSSGRA